MLLLKYLILGIIQGFTEPLPISSSGHLRIFKSIFNSEVLSDMNFEIIVNFGSLVAILVLYRKEIINIIKDFFCYIKTKEKRYEVNFKYAWLIAIGTIPAALLGLFVKDFIEEYFTTKLVGLMLIITSILLFIIKDIKGKKEKKDMTIKDAIKIGLFQVVALLPGISRSGATVVGGMKSNLTRETALNYSFMLYIPISLASMILGVSDLFSSGNLNELLIPYIVSMIAAGIVTYYAAKLFIDIMKKGKLIYFSIYCLIVGIITFIIF
ncbi:MAG: TSUP family transporter [Bacilli bacterium]|nr:TSUP family transporter [Bacilli bacterium]MBP3635591.1 TSUP family transporter [Bacilli bacterium]